ncbi:acyl carrier protein [candidate division KSB1 bacterium]|nr:acyl carrier protein [candidate division KSB1 bacterium]RQW11787.1 MAG: acyl carrier protein [candidate division KSB1 bacterium]
MDIETTKLEIKNLIQHTIDMNLTPEKLADDFKIAGDLLDSMAVTNLILALEEYFGFTFSDEELSLETFSTFESLAAVVHKKLEMLNG